MILTLVDKARTWLGKNSTPKCLQCGLPPGTELIVATDEPIIHPHRCSWCSSVLYVPGLMLSCKTCSEGWTEDQRAA